MMIRRARGQKRTEERAQLEYKRFTSMKHGHTGGARAASTGVRYDR
ncbi:MAG: hypothetical protein RTU63_10580 [Candidatus Thorarchaeota archaeon]